VHPEKNQALALQGTNKQAICCLWMKARNSSTLSTTILTTAMNRLRAPQDLRVTLREIDFDLNPVFFLARATLQKKFT
jgi:hypothetical protein